MNIEYRKKKISKQQFKNTAIRKQAKGMARHFTEEDMQIRWQMRRCSTLLAFRKMQIKSAEKLLYTYQNN